MVAETVEQQVEELTPGQRLKAAREARAIERSDIARWLKLDEKLICAIEDDDDEHLPEPVFITGYIRSYAKLVELSPDQLVEEFMKSHKLAAPNIAKQAEPVPGRMGKVAESLPKRFSVAANSHPVNVKWFVAISISIVLVGVISWISVFTGDSAPDQASIEQPQDLTGGPAVAVFKPTEEKGLGRENSDVGQGAPKSAQLDTTKTVKQESTPKRITVPLELKKKERSDPGAVEILGVENLASDTLEEISVRFSSDSWVDIRDARGKMLLRSLGVAGATKEVKGVAPFQVLIGYGPGVEITYNGAPFDFSRYQGKQEVARFTLNSTDKEKQQN